MFLSLNWLREYVDIPNNISVPDLTSLLNLHVVEVDNVINQENQFKNIVVGKILSIEEHPNADKLKKAVVNVGKEKLEIVCGAPNIKKGQLVPVALIGAIMPDGMEIKETLIRGEKSFGMLCSQRELKLGDDHSGILILDDSAKVGQLISDFLELNDCIFEIDNKSLTNRPDLWGYLGMAREIAIITKGKLKDVSVKDLTIEAKAPINVSVLSAENCPRYMALQIDNIKIEDSPWWLKKKLITSGLKPINNIVDITNYIMLETAQPMHAFNADSIMVGDIEKEIKIIVRMAEPGESIQSLDGEKRELSEMDIVIANRDELLAVAGVMGGAKSQITNSTKSIILESANFNPIAVRKTSKKLGLRTESSIRFEKGLDPSMAEIALNRAVNLLASLDKEARIVASADVKNYAQQLSVIKLELAWLQKRLGDLITFERVKEILEALGFGVKSLEDDLLTIYVPAWRAQEVSIKEDILEEVARIYGYNVIELKMPSVLLSSPPVNKELELETKIKNLLVGAPALTEVYNYSFGSKKYLSKCGSDINDYLELANPLSEELVYLRQSLIPDILLNIKSNQANYDDVDIFEIGRIFLNIESDTHKDASSKEMIPYQEKRLAIALASLGKESGLFKIKGIVEYLSVYLKAQVIWHEATNLPAWCDKDSSALVSINGINVGYVALLDKTIARAINIKKEVALCELRIPALLSAQENSEILQYRKPNKFPPVIRDLCFVLNVKISYNEIIEEIKNFNALIKDVVLFDVYSGEALGKGKKSMAFRITYLTDKNLVSEEIDVIEKELIKYLDKKLDAKIRI